MLNPRRTEQIQLHKSTKGGKGVQKGMIWQEADGSCEDYEQYFGSGGDGSVVSCGQIERASRWNDCVLWNKMGLA